MGGHNAGFSLILSAFCINTVLNMVETLGVI
jgi:hypothetical protein